MMERKILALVVVASLLVMASVGQALTTYMSEDPGNVSNGSFSDGPDPYTAGFWYNTPSAIPTGWTQGQNYMYTTGTLWMQCGTWAYALNNTGVAIPAGVQTFTINADLGGTDGTTALVFLWATENADGTGAREIIGELGRLGNSFDGYALTDVSTTVVGDAGLAGKYLQVQIGASYMLADGTGLLPYGQQPPEGDPTRLRNGGYYDNINVTSIPEPVTLALLGLGGLFLRRRKA
jgi:hypothetical protein